MVSGHPPLDERLRRNVDATLRRTPQGYSSGALLRTFIRPTWVPYGIVSLPRYGRLRTRVQPPSPTPRRCAPHRDSVGRRRRRCSSHARTAVSSTKLSAHFWWANSRSVTWNKPLNTSPTALRAARRCPSSRRSPTVFGAAPFIARRSRRSTQVDRSPVHRRVHSGHAAPTVLPTLAKPRLSAGPGSGTVARPPSASRRSPSRGHCRVWSHRHCRTHDRNRGRTSAGLDHPGSRCGRPGRSVRHASTPLSRWRGPPSAPSKMPWTGYVLTGPAGPTSVARWECRSRLPPRGSRWPELLPFTLADGCFVPDPVPDAPDTGRHPQPPTDTTRPLTRRSGSCRPGSGGGPRKRSDGPGHPLRWVRSNSRLREGER